MAICCAAPLLFVAGIAFFGLSLGALAGGALSFAALLGLSGGHVFNDAHDSEGQTVDPLYSGV
jgi:hypothetical protein